MRARLHSDESGFTLPELLTSMVIGMVVLLAAFMLLDRAVSTSSEVSDRQDSAQRGRLAMEVVSRELRSQVCLGDGQPITAGNDTSVTFYANLSSNADSADKRTLRYVAAEKRLYEDIYTGSGTFPTLTFPGFPAPRPARASCSIRCSRRGRHRHAADVPLLQVRSDSKPDGPDGAPPDDRLTAAHLAAVRDRRPTS